MAGTPHGRPAFSLHANAAAFPDGNITGVAGPADAEAIAFEIAGHGLAVQGTFHGQRVRRACRVDAPIVVAVVKHRPSENWRTVQGWREWPVGLVNNRPLRPWTAPWTAFGQPAGV